MNVRVVLLCGLLLVSVLGGAGSTAGSDSNVEEKSFESTELEYTVEFDKEARTVVVYAENPGGDEVGSSFSISVDGRTHTRKNFEIAPYDQKSWTVGVTDGISVMETEHVVAVESYGGNATFRFVEQFDTEAPGDVPVPHILDIEVEEGIARGNQSMLVAITVTNPTKQTYHMHLLVHTFHIDGSFPGFSVMPGETKVVEAEVYEPLGSRVSGEVRLFLQRAGQPRHPLQQFEFTGRANGTTEYWEESYREIPGPEAENQYHYENATLDPTRGPYGIPTDAASLACYGATATLLVGLILAWRKLTSPA